MTAPGGVTRMFDRIAPAYDLMNSVISVGLDASWRRATLAAAELVPGLRVLDVACGTGKLARGAARAVGRDGTVVGLDASSGMLARARRARPAGREAAVRWQLGDATRLPYPDAAFDVALIGFGLRNLPDPATGLQEMARVTAPGGRVLVLEIARPTARLPRLAFALWFRRLVPLLGRLIGRGSAYAYLPASLKAYPPPQRVGELMAAAGLTRVRWRWLRGGMTTLHLGEVPR